MNKEIIKTPSGETIYQYNFDNLVELVDYVSDSNINSRIFNANNLSSNGKDYDWYKTNSFDDSLELCLKGEEALDNLFNESNLELSKFFPFLSQKRNIVTSYYGHRPNVSRYLTSNPRCMYKLERNEAYNFVDIHYNVCASSISSTNSILNRGIILINVIKFLESLGYRVRLNFFELCKEGDEYFYASVNLKRLEERISPSICYFPMCNPSFLRRILFRLKESTEFKLDGWSDSYGSVLNLYQLNNVCENLLNFNMDKSILIGNPSDINVSGKDLLVDTINFIENIELNKYLGQNQLNYDENSKSFVLKRKR